MKIIVAYEVTQSSYRAIQELAKQSMLRDIDLNGVELSVERGEYTCVEESTGEDTTDASSVLDAVNKVISGEWIAPEGKGKTIFATYYNKDR